MKAIQVRVTSSSQRSEIDVEDSGSGRKERIYIRSTSTPKHYTYNSFPFHIENWYWQHFHIMSTVALSKVDGNTPHRPQINTHLHQSLTSLLLQYQTHSPDLPPIQYHRRHYDFLKQTVSKPTYQTHAHDKA